MKSGQIVYIPDETVEAATGEKKTIDGGKVRLEEKLSSTDKFEIWLVYFIDNRYEYSVQRLFFKNSLPQQTTLTKERIMATKKKKVKKSANKKAVKKVVTKKKVATKKKVKKDKVEPLSCFVANLIVSRKNTDTKIVSITQKKYPKYKHTGLRTVAYYRNFLNEGKMNKSGFPKPSKPYKEVGGVAKKEERKVAKRKVAQRKKN